MKPHKLAKIYIWSILALSVFLWAQMGLLDPSQMISAIKRLGLFFSGLFPPHLAIFPKLMPAILETIKMSLAGTVLGFILSLPLAILSTKTLFGKGVVSSARSVIGAIRTIPSILFGVIFVVAFGLGPTAGTVAIAFYTVGYLAKLFYEAFEGVDREVIEAVRGVRCNRLQLMRFAIIPETANTVISQLLFMFEYNIRSSTIMGFVGAGGIGYYMLGYVQMFQYQNLMAALLMTFLVVMAIDYLSLKLRSMLVVSARTSENG